MRTEIALTPHTLQPCSIDAGAWAGQLRALNQRLVHYGSQCPLIFSNLNDGQARPTAAWLAVVAGNFAAFKPAEHRAARDLFDRIKREYLVSRPSQQQVQAATKEEQWVKEAVHHAPNYPINQIVTSRLGANACHKVFTRALGLNDLDGAPFWNGITVSALPAMNISDQVVVLHPIWLHGQILAVVLPYGLDTTRVGEANWFFAFASRAYARPAGHGEAAIELHVSFDGNGTDMQAQGAAYPAIVNFVQAAQRQAEL